MTTLEDEWFAAYTRRHPELPEASRRRMARGMALQGVPPPEPRPPGRTLRGELVDALGLEQKLELWRLSRWWKQRGGTAVMNVLVHNAKTAWLISLLGVLVISFSGACAAGNEVFSHETCTKILLATNFLSGIIHLVSPGPTTPAAPAK